MYTNSPIGSNTTTRVTSHRRSEPLRMYRISVRALILTVVWLFSGKEVDKYEGIDG